MIRTFLALVGLFALGFGGCATHAPHQGTPVPQLEQPTLPAGNFVDLTPHKEGIASIIKEMTSNKRAYAKMVELCDGIGHRLTGSKNLEKAVQWAVDLMKKEGHENVGTEEVMVRRWVRGKESVTLLLPREVPLIMLGLGNSIGTPPEGIEADVIVVKDEAELKAAGDKVAGKIVLFNNPMPPWTREKGAHYGHTVRFRVHGPKMAADLGAVAVLVRSVTAHSLATPHTGTLYYGDAKNKIPGAALTTEDAEMLARMQAKGERLRVRLKMEARFEGEVPSHNVIAELRGRENPEEIVIISGHLDAWDVGQGAHDDASGVVMAMEGLHVLRKLGLRPRRTVRVVLWTNEENGMRGARGYVKRHKANMKNHVAALEADSGGFAPDAFGVAVKDKSKQAVAAAQLEAVMTLLKELAMIKVKPGRSAADVGKLVPEGVPAIGLYTYGAKYFDYHHTHADTVDKVDPDELARSAAAITALTWIIAEMPNRLGDKP